MPMMIEQKPATAHVKPKQNLSDDIKKCLDEHNEPRKAKGLAPLEWDATLAANALKWAEENAQTKSMHHSSGSGEGENLYWSSGSDHTPFADAAKAWMDEVKNYHHERVADGNFESYGHYTQCMWKTTTHVGLGTAKAADGSTYVCGRYSPPGNWMGQTPY